MLPKVAGQILHHTSRAVAVVQGQAGHAVRNALQTGQTNLGQWNGPGSSSSGWNGSGPSSGGAKFHSSSSRFQANYAGAGRSVAQADASSSFTDSLDTSDEGIELVSSQDSTVSIHSGKRIRSASLSFTLQAPKEVESRSVLKAIQNHIRSRHAFAPSQEVSTKDVRSPPEPPLLEHSSSSAAADAAVESQPDTLAKDQGLCSALLRARESGDVEAAMREIQSLRSSPQPSTDVYNHILDVLRTLRSPGDPLDEIMAVYGEMIARSIRPNVRTYNLLILALMDRETEVFHTIRATELRLTRRKLTGTTDEATEALEKYITDLKSETNFTSALTLYNTVRSVRRDGFWGPNGEGDMTVHHALIRSCAHREDLKAAAQIWLEVQKLVKISNRRVHAMLFVDMIRVHAACSDMGSAESVLKEFQDLARVGRITYPRDDRTGQQLTMLIWNTMIRGHIKSGHAEQGLKVLEKMLDSSTGDSYSPSDIPPPSPATFSAIISAFCQSGDVSSGLIWFERLLQQKDLPTSSLGPSAVPTRPLTTTWREIITELASAGMVDDLNRIVQLAQQDNIDLSQFNWAVILNANLDYINAHPEMNRSAALALLNVAVQADCSAFFVGGTGSPLENRLFSRLIQTYLQFGETDLALQYAERYISKAWTVIHRAEADANPELTQSRIKALRKSIQSVTPLFLGEDAALSSKQVLSFGALSASVQLSPTPDLATLYMLAYGEGRSSLSHLQLTTGEWNIVLHSAVTMDRFGLSDGLPAVEEVLQDCASHYDFHFSIFPHKLVRQIADSFISKHGYEWTRSFMLSLDSSISSFVDTLTPETERRVMEPIDEVVPLVITMPDSVPTSHVHVDQHHSKFVDECCTGFSAQIDTAYRRFEGGLTTGVYPNPEVLGRLINGVGRRGELDRVGILYDAAQAVLASLEHDKQWQSLGWFQVEDQMIIALAHAGETDAAHVHRNRILAHGGTPSADAYAALIQRVKDTTDDTANALTLFEEARMRGVSANIFLYNTVISKLAKARKVDHALELFQEMKAAGFRPTSVTYGAVIAACCRVGDAQSAEVLFQEMSSQPNFKPRVPPFNTMMQLYTHTKPDRERVLYYANALLRANVSYTAHTYKLLMDAYGTIEPLDVDAMEKTFKQLEKDRGVTINGAHWSSLINAYGCAKKDLDKAVSVFESIAKHPSSRQTRLPDAICFEALLNVLVTLKRYDLIPQYVARLSDHNVHMTAYIANLVIKGYAAGGNIEDARDVFENLADPPEGVAAPNNHAAHDSAPRNVPSNAPVYREPSTWETMVRAELGNGHRERALALLERLKARRFPPAVYSRISGILSTDPALIWDVSSSLDFSQSPLSE